MIRGVSCARCRRNFRLGSPGDPCRACGGALMTILHLHADMKFSDAEFPAPVRFDVATYVRYLAEALGRVIECDRNVARVAQRCPICEAELAVWLPRTVDSGDALCRELFSLYDDHRCSIDPAQIGEQRERALQAAEQAAIRAEALRKREAVEPPIDMPSLYERAEREAVLLAEWAARF